MSAPLNPFEDYVFQSFAGVENCDYCDSFTHTNEWLRPDGGIVFVCNNCQYSKRFPEIKAQKNG
jgi:RNase P subunit RPR2